MSAAAIEVLLGAWALALGASLGSFLNVVVARLPRGLSVVSPRSRCPRCLAPIAWYDNVPVVSFILLRARCRGCGAPISARYPLVELLGAGAALLALRRHGVSLDALSELCLVAFLLALAFIDLDTWLLPHALTWPLLAMGLLLSAAGATPAGSVLPAVFGAAIGFAAFALVAVVGKRVFGREAMGFGDVWLLAGIGAWMGWKALLPVILLASLQGTAVGLVLAVLGRLPTGERGMNAREAKEGEADDWVPPRNAVPFGPFLVAGALEWLYLSGLLARAVPALDLFA